MDDIILNERFINEYLDKIKDTQADTIVLNKQWYNMLEDGIDKSKTLFKSYIFNSLKSYIGTTGIIQSVIAAGFVASFAHLMTRKEDNFSKHKAILDDKYKYDCETLKTDMFKKNLLDFCNSVSGVEYYGSFLERYLENDNTNDKMISTILLNSSVRIYKNSELDKLLTGIVDELCIFNSKIYDEFYNRTLINDSIDWLKEDMQLGGTIDEIIKVINEELLPLKNPVVYVNLPKLENRLVDILAIFLRNNNSNMQSFINLFKKKSETDENFKNAARNLLNDILIIILHPILKQWGILIHNQTSDFSSLRAFIKAIISPKKFIAKFNTKNINFNDTEGIKQTVSTAVSSVFNIFKNSLAWVSSSSGRIITNILGIVFLDIFSAGATHLGGLSIGSINDDIFMNSKFNRENVSCNTVYKDKRNNYFLKSRSHETIESCAKYMCKVKHPMFCKDTCNTNEINNEFNKTSQEDSSCFHTSIKNKMLKNLQENYNENSLLMSAINGSFLSRLIVTSEFYIDKTSHINTIIEQLLNTETFRISTSLNELENLIGYILNLIKKTTADTTIGNAIVFIIQEILRNSYIAKDISSEIFPEDNDGNTQIPQMIKNILYHIRNNNELIIVSTLIEPFVYTWGLDLYYSNPLSFNITSECLNKEGDNNTKLSGGEQNTHKEYKCKDIIKPITNINNECLLEQIQNNFLLRKEYIKQYFVKIRHADNTISMNIRGYVDNETEVKHKIFIDNDKNKNSDTRKFSTIKGSKITLSSILNNVKNDLMNEEIFNAKKEKFFNDKNISGNNNYELIDVVEFSSYISVSKETVNNSIEIHDYISQLNTGTTTKDIYNETTILYNKENNNKNMTIENQSSLNYKNIDFKYYYSPEHLILNTNDKIYNYWNTRNNQTNNSMYDILKITNMDLKYLIIKNLNPVSLTRIGKPYYDKTNDTNISKNPNFLYNLIWSNKIEVDKPIKNDLCDLQPNKKYLFEIHMIYNIDDNIRDILYMLGEPRESKKKLRYVYDLNNLVNLSELSSMNFSNKIYSLFKRYYFLNGYTLLIKYKECNSNCDNNKDWKPQSNKDKFVFENGNYDSDDEPDEDNGHIIHFNQTIKNEEPYYDVIVPLNRLSQGSILGINNFTPERFEYLYYTKYNTNFKHEYLTRINEIIKTIEETINNMNPHPLQVLMDYGEKISKIVNLSNKEEEQKIVSEYLPICKQINIDLQNIIDTSITDLDNEFYDNNTLLNRLEVPSVKKMENFKFSSDLEGKISDIVDGIYQLKDTFETTIKTLESKEVSFFKLCKDTVCSLIDSGKQGASNLAMSAYITSMFLSDFALGQEPEFNTFMGGKKMNYLKLKQVKTHKKKKRKFQKSNKNKK